MAEDKIAEEEVVSEEEKVGSEESSEEIEAISASEEGTSESEEDSSASGENEVAESSQEGESDAETEPGLMVETVAAQSTVGVGNLTAPTVSGEAQAIVMNPYATGGQVIMVGQPSSAPGFIGVVCIVLGVFSVLGIGLAFLDAKDPGTGETIVVSMKLKVFNAFSNAVSAITLIIGGVWLKARQRKGVHMLWISIALSFALGVIGLFLGGDSYIADVSGNRLSSGQAMGIGIAFDAFCNGICFAIVSIPLMVQNSGLDKSSLFGGSNGNDYVKQY